MPYIIETHREGGWPHTTSMRDVISRRAVATLDEALDRSLLSRRDWSELTNHGGTSGLPDGIEVERVEWRELGEPPAGSFGFKQDVLDAYNEAQS